MATREQIDILFKMHADLQDMRRLQTETARSRKQLGDLGTLLKRGLGLTVGIASFGALTAVIKRNTMAAIENGAALYDNARLYGVSAEFLQTWRYAAEQNGIATNQADVALQRFTRRLGEAAQGKGELLPILKQYNIAITDSQGRTRANTDVLQDFANLLQNTRDPAERLRIAVNLFDSEGAKLASVLADGADGLEAVNAEMRETNKLISEDNVEALKRASDAMTAFGTNLKATFANATAEVWSTVEAIMYLAAESKKDQRLREQAVAELTGLDIDALPASERARTRTLSRARRDTGLTNEQIDTRVEEIKVRLIKEQIAARREALSVAEQEAAALAAAAAEEKRRSALETQAAALRKSIAEYEERLRYERLSQEDKLAFQLARRAELEGALETAVLTEEQRNEKLREHEETLKRILDLELRIESTKGASTATGPSGSGTATGGTDPLDAYVQRLEAMQNPQLLLINSMDSMFASIDQQIQGLIQGTITWEQALRNVGGAIASSVITTFAQMAAAAIANYILTQVGIEAIQTAAMGKTAMLAGQAAGMWIPAAMAASIATLGSASGIGAAAFAAAMLSGAVSATLAAGIGGYGMAIAGSAGSAAGSVPGAATGGMLRGPGTGTSDSMLARLSAGEFVVRSGAVDYWGENLMHFLNEGRPPRPFAAGGGAGGGGAGAITVPAPNVNLRVYDDRRAALRDQLRADPDAQDYIVDLARRRRAELA